jgi:hypothetical protein
MDDTERRLLLAIYRSNPEVTFVRDICQVVGNYEQNQYYLASWWLSGWYEYHTSLDLGWLTDLGKEVAANLDLFGRIKEKTPTVGSD